MLNYCIHRVFFRQQFLFLENTRLKLKNYSESGTLYAHHTLDAYPKVIISDHVEQIGLIWLCHVQIKGLIHKVMMTLWESY